MIHILITIQTSLKHQTMTNLSLNQTPNIPSRYKQKRVCKIICF
jgi:hypothetical protein